MALYPKPAEGSWTEHFPGVGTGVLSYEDCISPEFYQAESEAIFKRAWLNVGRVEDVPRPGSYFTKEIEVAATSLLVVRDLTGEVRAFHNVCRHRGNKLMWNDYPREETAGSCRAFTCKYHGWRYDLTGKLTFVQQEGEFFDLDKADYGLIPVACEVWAGFIFINLAKYPEPLQDFLGSMVTELTGYPFDALTERYDFTADIRCNWKIFLDAFQEYYHVPVLHSQEATPTARPKMPGFEAPYYNLDGPHRMVATSGAPRRRWPADYQYPIEIATRSGLFGPWNEPDLGDDLPGVNPGGIKAWQMSNFQIFPNMEILIWQTGWYMLYRYWPTSHESHRFEGSLFFPPAKNASDRAAQECAVVMFKEFALQDAGMLVGTQQGLASRAVRDDFPLNDQELLVRHFHNSVASWVDGYQREKAGV
ncbi:aromatic ring-hydroxylating dioxygenase subunit alpha [Frankia sp. AgB1.9]|uniref:aromatic ring-hydroxylating oxygenase subunit alpha n=1 Tax=unclassified Frankia TaxID=2632575 RepID=UPI0019326B67|nr:MULTISPECIES: aromatic ring-hydroxylating dioxygenase subunit alpha [unclassified Frankia]MBL7492988.1 aromatic ring-hydroxylating dioxygenase subunit alpha [Frankia sp. AgW1.1]MBL7549592.1 aromatic ring-hydroxylating dioxygenase subunit alpha [Frankia sp. AgB1.9]MBL7620427.1 aromatic ring-hydroxylating dioxygenase subunit alpha [Frankia sp. AgB1.8]